VSKMYAELEGSVVVNIIVADESFVNSQENPERFVEYTEQNPAFIDGDYVGGYFYAPQPYPSWSRNGAGLWVAPVERPQYADYWDEENQQWVLLTELPD